MIHSLGKRRSIRSMATAEAKKRQETRDAILWEILPTQRICRVKIQGSETLVTAYFPQNWTSVPRWLKVGNAVRLLHAGGKRNRLEVIGDGGTIPTPVPGGTAAPTLATGVNCILTGCQVHALSGMSVKVQSGTYRINDVVYTLTASILFGQHYLFGQHFLFGGGWATVAIDAAETSEYRIDALVIGIDGVIDYIKGTPSATNPQEPTIPAAHVLMATILVPPGVTEILEWYINYNLVDPFPAQIMATASIDRLIWSDASSTITIEVLDQYGTPIIGTNWGITCTITDGTGYLGSGGAAATVYTGTTDNEATVTYHRMTDYDVYPYPGENCPVFITLELIQKDSVTMLVPLLLEDEYGMPIV